MTYSKILISLFYALVLYLSDKAGDKALALSSFALIAAFLLISSKD